MARRMTGVVRDRHGTCYARRTVPKALQEAVAQVLGEGKDRQVFLKRSLGTKDIREANIRAKPVQQQFDLILEQARALLKERPKRERLSAVEIKRLADYHFASMLASDEDETRDGTGGDELLRSVAKQLEEAGVEIAMPLPLDTSRPPLSATSVQSRNCAVSAVPYRADMRTFVFRCPRTGLKVQGFTVDDLVENGTDEFVQVKCHACGSVHFVSPTAQSTDDDAAS
jgi:hypothetical protein